MTFTVTRDGLQPASGEGRAWHRWVAPILVLTLLWLSVPAGAQSPFPERPTGTDFGAAIWMEVSPDYARTGTVIAATSKLRTCIEDCISIWITHNGGWSWKKVKASGWKVGRPRIAVDSSGREIFFSSGDMYRMTQVKPILHPVSNQLKASEVEFQRSDDGGETWTSAGPNGIGTASPAFPTDGMIAVAGNPGYLIRNGVTQPVAGSSGALNDLQFAFAPSYPDTGGIHPPALLAGTDKETGRPVVSRCDANLTCKGLAVLPGSRANLLTPLFLFSSNYTKDGTVFAQTAGGSIFKSVDGATSFTQLTVAETGATTSGPTGMALSPEYRESGPVRTAYVSIFEIYVLANKPKTRGGIYKTTDGGKTWNAIGDPGPFDEGARAVVSSPDGRLFGSYLLVDRTGGVLCSDDGGNTWRVACTATAGPDKGKGAQSAAVGPLGENISAAHRKPFISSTGLKVAILAIATLLVVGTISLLARRSRAMAS